MKVLNLIRSSDLMAIDIETVRIEKDFADLSDGWKSAWEYKNKQDGEIPDFDDLAEKWEKNASLYAEFSKVCAVSLAFLSKEGDKLMCQEFFGEDEVALLSDLSSFLERIGASGKKYRLVAHAGKFFDYPFLAKRFIINGFDIPQILDVTDKKPWEGTNLCTNELWKVGGMGAGSSLQALCMCLGIPVSKVDLVGDEVGKAFYDGEKLKISRYCSYDTIATFNVVRKFKNEDIFEFDKVIYMGSESGVAKIKNETEAEKPKAVKNKLKEIVNGGKVSDKDFDDVLNIIENAGATAAPLAEIVDKFSSSN